MTEAEWLRCEDARKMLLCLHRHASERKLRLFTCAFWRWDEQVAQNVCDRQTTMAQALRCIENRADNRSYTCGVKLPMWIKWHPLTARNAFDGANWTVRNRKNYWCRPALEAAETQVQLVRDIFGNPFRPAAIEPAWVTPTVRQLTQAIYDERAFDRLPVLADALEEAGCTDADILGHCRALGPHVRGCWPVDLILGRE